MKSSPAAPRIATKVARHSRIVELLTTNSIESQSQLGDLLTKAGLSVTQATLSRDLDELGAFKVVNSSGHTVYVVPQDGGDPAPRLGETPSSARSRLERVVGELMSSAAHSGNIVVLRTPPGAAQYLASTIDHTALPDVIGTIAGDDTVLLVTKDARGGSVVARDFAAMGARKSTGTRGSGLL